MTGAEWRTNFSDRVSDKMERLKINQRELSGLTHIPESTLSRYLNGERTPKADAVANIAKALECSVVELIQFGEMVVK